MQDIWYETPVKGSFDSQEVMTHKLRSTGLKEYWDVKDQEEEQTEDDEDLYSGY